MKSHLKTLCSGSPRPHLLAREYLQAKILRGLHDAGAFGSIAFVGGTALRFLYGIPRFSEDLDFSASSPGKRLDLAGVIANVGNLLKAEGYGPDVSLRADRTVSRADISFRGLPFELGFSGHRTKALTIKVEIDTNPPENAGFEVSLVRRHEMVRILHHDRESLLAGKLHAILARPWVKGRDLYDLVWYLSDRAWPPPNVQFLQAGLRQSGIVGDAMCWRELVAERISNADWRKVSEDVLPFLENTREAEFLSEDVLLGLLKKSRPSEEGIAPRYDDPDVSTGVVL